MPLWNYAFNQGGPDPDYVYSTAEIDSRWRLPDLGIPRHLALRRDHAARLRHDEPGRHGRGRPGTAHPRPRRPHPRRRRLLQRRAQRRAPRGPRRRLVGAGPGHPSAPDAQLLVRLEQRGRRPGRDRATRRRRCRHDARGDRAPLLRPGGVDRGDDRLRHGAGALLPRAPRREHVPAFDEDRRDGRPAEAGVLRRHPRDRRRRGADPRDRAPGAGPLLAGAGRRRPLLHRRLGEPAVEPQRRAGAHRQRRQVPRRHLARSTPACPTGSTRPTTRGASSRCGGTGPATIPTRPSRRCQLADVREHLPADTPVVTPAERREQLRRRREGAQLRRIW